MGFTGNMDHQWWKCIPGFHSFIFTTHMVHLWAMWCLSTNNLVEPWSSHFSSLPTPWSVFMSHFPGLPPHMPTEKSHITPLISWPSWSLLVTPSHVANYFDGHLSTTQQDWNRCSRWGSVHAFARYSYRHLRQCLASNSGNLGTYRTCMVTLAKGRELCSHAR